MKHKLDIGPSASALMLEEVDGVLERYLGFCPSELAVIVGDARAGKARTFFASHRNDDPSETLRELLRQAKQVHDARHPPPSPQ